MSCLPLGNCSQKHIIQGFELEDKTYGLEDARVLRAMSFQNAKMISGNYITVVPNVKDKVRMFRDDFNTQYQSEATGGRSKDQCGPFKPSGEYKKELDKFLEVKYLYNEAVVCYKKLIGKYKQDSLRAGAGLSEENVSLNDMLLTAMIRDNNIQTDKLIWNGDYKSAQREVSHYDGLVKRIFQAIGGSTAEVIDFTFAGLQAGDVVEGFAGGYTINVPFNTDNDTTAGDVGAAIAALNDELGNPLYTVNVVGGVVTVTANTPGKPIDILLVVTDGTGLNDCDEAATPGQGTVTEVVTTPNVSADSPQTITYSVVTVNNVLDIFEALYTEVSKNTPWLLDRDDFNFHVSDHVWAMMTIALTKQTAAFSGVCDRIECGPFGLRVVKQPYLTGSAIVGAQSSNLFFGTDLVSDMSDADQWVNKDCQEVRFRMETCQGVNIGEFNEVIANFDGAPFSFQPAQ